MLRKIKLLFYKNNKNNKQSEIKPNYKYCSLRDNVSFAQINVK